MIPEYGLIALILAFVISLFQASGLFSLHKTSKKFQKTLPLLILSHTFFIFSAALILFYVLLTGDLSVQYVAEHVNASLPTFYRLAAFWGGHEGSLLMWIVIAAGWQLVAFYHGRKVLEPALWTRLLSILGFIQAGFLALLLFVSNPFARLLPLVPLTGEALNPLLQDPALAVHPPFLYAGYVGLCLPFALACAVLWNNTFSESIVRVMKSWLLLALAFLTVGITLGSFWAYYELGWGGFWFWDPVENASLMPWLVGVALLHSLLAAEKKQVRGHPREVPLQKVLVGAGFMPALFEIPQQQVLSRWILFLAICGFSLSVLGTFLVRSGLLISVHSFAVDPARGIAILLWLGLLIGSAFILYAIRSAKIHTTELKKGAVIFLWMGSVVLFIMMLSILLGTVYPLFLEGLTGSHISVGTPYFNFILIPFITLAAILMNVGVIITPSPSRKILLNALIQGIGIPILTLFFLILLINVSLLKGLWGMSLAALILGGVVIHGIRKKQCNGMMVAHTGLAVFLMGITIVSTFQIEEDQVMTLNTPITLGKYTLELKALRNLKTVDYEGVQGNIVLSPKNKMLRPEKRYYSSMSTSETAIDSTMMRDIYVALSEPISEHAWIVRLQYKPGMRLIWCGALLIAVGFLIALVFRRESK